mmetsp:Transcript_915/g.1001  ORF Transcript_915/g.1001 Transcript_915/m.1001 type:complete len:93 (-) Transcript_915:42-320(-)
MIRTTAGDGSMRFVSYPTTTRRKKIKISYYRISFWHSFAPRPPLKTVVGSKFITIKCRMQLVYHTDDTNNSWRRVDAFRFISNNNKKKKNKN